MLSKVFHVADLDPTGDVRAVTEYSYDQLGQIPGAIELIGYFSGLLWQNPREFDAPFPDGQKHLSYRWLASAETAGVATMRRRGELASLALLASGIDADADRLTLEAFHHHLLRELRDTGFEPAFDLLHLRQRPLVLVVGFCEPAEQLDQLLLALADRCFAAAYFRYQKLA